MLEISFVGRKEGEKKTQYPPKGKKKIKTDRVRMYLVLYFDNHPREIDKTQY